MLRTLVVVVVEVVWGTVGEVVVVEVVWGTVGEVVAVEVVWGTVGEVVAVEEIFELVVLSGDPVWVSAVVSLVVLLKQSDEYG